MFRHIYTYLYKVSIHTNNNQTKRNTGGGICAAGGSATEFGRLPRTQYLARLQEHSPTHKAEPVLGLHSSSSSSVIR